MSNNQIVHQGKYYTVYLLMDHIPGDKPDQPPKNYAVIHNVHNTTECLTTMLPDALQVFHALEETLDQVISTLMAGDVVKASSDGGKLH